MIIIGNFISNVRDLSFDPGLMFFDKPFSDIAEFQGVFLRAVFKNTFACLKSQVEAIKIGVFFFEVVDNSREWVKRVRNISPS